MSMKPLIIIALLFSFACFGVPVNPGSGCGSGIAWAEDDTAYAQRLVRDLEEAVKSGNQQRILEAHRRVQSHESARFMLNQQPALLRQLGQVQQSIISPRTVAGAPAPAPAVSAAPAGSRVSAPADSAPPSSGGSKFYNPEGTGYQGSIQVDTPASGSGSVTSYSQARANIHDIAQKINPQPPDPKQVKEWADSIRRPGSSEPPKQIEKFSGGDPSWSEINKRVNAASEPLYSKDQIRAVKDPDLARLANPAGNYVKSEGDDQLARLAGKEPRPPTTAERMGAYQQAQQQASQRREGMVDSLRSGYPDQVKYSALQVREDPLAVKQANIKETPEIKTRMNEPLAHVQSNMEPGIKDSIAQRYGVKPDQVTVHYSTNPRDPSKGPKVNQDTDITIRVGGKDVPADVARPVVNEQFYRVAGGDKAAPGMNPEKFAEKHYMETTDRLSRQAYGSSPAEGDQILKGSKSQPIRDANQVGMAMEDKYNVPRNQAIELTQKGRLPEAEVQRGLAMDQTVKQYDAQIKSRVEKMGGKVPEQVQKGVDVLRDVREGRTSPVEAEASLRRMGETPESITQKATGLVEAGQKLQGPGKGGVPDKVAAETFNENVKGRLELKNLERQARASETGAFEPIDPSKGPGKGPGPADTGAFKPVSDQTPTGRTPLTKGESSFQEPTVGGTLPPGASGLRRGLNVVGEAGLVVGAGIAAAGIGRDLGEGYKERSAAEELRTKAQIAREQGKENEALVFDSAAASLEKSGKEKYKEAGLGAAEVGAWTAAGTVAPAATAAAGGAVLGYSIGRYGMENTETGRALDKLKEDYLDEPGSATDSLYRGWESLKDKAGGLLGGETGDQRKSRERKELQETFQRALDDGQLKLQPGVERDDLMAYLQIANLGRPADRKGLDDFLAGTPPPPGQFKENVAPTGGEPGGTAPDKSRQELDIEAYQALQALEKIKKDAEQKPVDKQTTPVVEPEKQEKEPVVEPVKPEVDPTKGEGNKESGGVGSDTTGITPNQEGSQAGGATDTSVDQTTPATGTDSNLVSRLRGAENRTGGAQSSGVGSDANLQLALNANVTGSVLQTQDLQRLQKFQQTMGSIGGTQAERAAAAQNQQMIDQSRGQAQGQQTGQAIAANSQEFVTAQQTLQMTRQNSLGNILLDSLMGGFTSGVAVGIDRFGSIVGSAAGQQVSGNWGLPLPPPPPQTGTGLTGNQTSDGQAGSTIQTSTSTTAVTSPTTGAVSTASGTRSGTRTTTQTAGTSSGGTTQISRPPVKPPATGGTKSCRKPGTCPYTGYADKNGCCTYCGKKVARK